MRRSLPTIARTYSSMTQLHAQCFTGNVNEGTSLAGLEISHRSDSTISIRVSQLSKPSSAKV